MTKESVVSVVLLLDLSAAFDTVDQSKLLEILSKEIGIKGNALSWFSSFLLDRTQSVKIGNSQSLEQPLPYGVPQGSILGPRLFNIYIRSLYKHVSKTNVNIEGFADDHQLVKQFVVETQSISLGHSIRQCLNSISEWMQTYFLCLNENKTKIIVISPPQVQKQILIQGVNLDESCIRFVANAKNLGILLDNLLSFNCQIQKVVKSSYRTICEFWRIKCFLTEMQLHQLVCAKIFSSMDNCNVLYYGISVANIQKLQRVQNCAARPVCKNHVSTAESLDSMTIKFHWLKVEFRIIYKLLLIVHRCVYKNAPEPIAALVSTSDSQRTIRLTETTYKSSYGARAFSHVAPKLWNLLPNKICEQQDIDKYKKELKTFLMTRGDEFLCWVKRK